MKVLNFQFTDIGYDENMAKVLLASQQAQADLNSRKILSEGVASIALLTIEKLEEGGVKFSEEKKAEAAATLLYIFAQRKEGNLNLFINASEKGAAAAAGSQS